MSSATVKIIPSGYDTDPRMGAAMKMENRSFQNEILVHGDVAGYVSAAGLLEVAFGQKGREKSKEREMDLLEGIWKRGPGEGRRCKCA